MILVSNDDGIFAPGLRALAEAMRELDEVAVVAPDQNQSATSHSLTLHRPLRVQNRKPGVWSVDGTPTDCVHIGIHALLEQRPRLVVSGINDGGNLGEDVIYSGTVAAAMEGAIIGIPSVAFSLTGQGQDDFTLAAEVARNVARRVMERGLPAGTLLNVNIPHGVGESARGYKVCPQGKRIYSGTIEERSDPRGRPYYWIGGEGSKWEEIAGTDLMAISEGYVTVTPLMIDLTARDLFERLGEWGF